MPTYERIGSGWYATVFGIGPYAVKVGRVHPEGVELQQRAARVGLSVPVVAFHHGLPAASLPAELLGQLCPIEARTDGLLDVLVMGRALPALATPSWTGLDTQLVGNLYRASERLAKRIVRLAGVTWEDPHPWNLGYYDNHLVALDWGVGEL